MTDEYLPEQSETSKPPTGDAAGVPPGEHSTGGAKLFVIFFLAVVPLLGIALLAMVIYSLLMR